MNNKMKQHVKKNWFPYLITVLLLGLSSYLYVHEKIRVVNILGIEKLKNDQINQTTFLVQKGNSNLTKVFSWLKKEISDEGDKQKIEGYLKSISEMLDFEEVQILNKVNRIILSTNKLNEGKPYAKMANQNQDHRMIRQDISTGSVVFMFKDSGTK